MTAGTLPETRPYPEFDLRQEQDVAAGRLFEDTFQHWRGQPGDPGSEDMLRQAWETHALGYQRTGLAKPEAVHDGLLDPVIDKSRDRTTGITYYLATNPADPKDRSTARLIDVASIEELPTYPLTKDGIHPDALERLEDAIRAGKQIRELGALANSLPGNSAGARETLRNILGDTVGRNQLLFCSMVVETRRGLMHSLAPANLEPIGEEVALPENDYRKETTLVPIVIDPDTFVQNILDAYDQEDRPGAKARYLQSVLFYSDGLPPELTPPRILELRAVALQSQDSALAMQPPTVSLKASSMLASYPELTDQAEPWSEPQMFDLSTPDDRERLKQAIDSGAIRNKHDPVSILAQELAKYHFPDGGRHSAERLTYIEDALAQGDSFGTWVFFPWSGTLSRFPNKEDYQKLRTSRNRDLITDAEQAELLTKRIAVIGLSVGSRALSTLVESGIGGEYIIADADHVETTNLGRLLAGYPSVGESKVDVAAKAVSEKDPWLGQVLLRNGLRIQDLARLGLGSSELPDLIVEEVDDMATKALVRWFAETYRIPIVSAADIGDKSVIDVERHDIPKDRKAVPFLGRISRRDTRMLSDKVGQLSEADNEKFMLKLAGLRHLSVRMMRSAMGKGTRLGGLPQEGMTATRGGANVALAAREILLGRGPKSGRYVDSPRQVFGLPREFSIAAGVKTAVALVRHVGRAKRAASR